MNKIRADWSKEISWGSIHESRWSAKRHQLRNSQHDACCLKGKKLRHPVCFKHHFEYRLHEDVDGRMLIVRITDTIRREEKVDAKHICTRDLENEYINMSKRLYIHYFSYTTFSPRKTLLTMPSTSTSVLMALMASSSSSTSSSKSTRSSPSGKTGYRFRSSCPNWVCTVTRAVAAPWQSPWPVISLAWLGMSYRRSTSRAPLAFTSVVAWFVAWWRA
jgi:hypothetical protein